MNISGNTITILGFTFLITFVLIKIFGFYGITSDYYGIYLVFYLFLIICTLLFPLQYTNILSKLEK